jgi:glycosyltransferase involved in cell wall biosynthesis
MDAQRTDLGAVDTAPSVAFVSSYGRLGGSEIYLERLLAYVERSSVRSVIVLGNGALVQRVRGLHFGVDVVPTSGHPRSFINSAWKVRRLLLQRRPDVVHANGIKAAIVSVLAAWGLRLPVVWVRHDFSMEGWRARALARMCTRVVCVSNVLTNTFRNSLQHKVSVVYTGMPYVDVAREDARIALLDLLSEPRLDPIISLVGHLVPGKGHIELIETAPELLHQLPNARIVIVGGLPTDLYASYVKGLEARVAELGLSKNVSFVGHRDDALRVIAGSDIVVIPSVSDHVEAQTEGFPLLGLEALAVGTPVVAYAIGGLPELLGDCGALVPPRDRKALRDAIVRVATDRIAWERMSACGRKRVRDFFSPAAMVASLEQVYRLAVRT